MKRKRHIPEQIVEKLRRPYILLGQGQTVAHVLQAGVIRSSVTLLGSTCSDLVPPPGYGKGYNLKTGQRE